MVQALTKSGFGPRFDAADRGAGARFCFLVRASSLRGRNPVTRRAVLVSMARLGLPEARMNANIQDYLKSARYCDQMAAMTADTPVSAKFAELARQWRELARQRQDVEKRPA